MFRGKSFLPGTFFISAWSSFLTKYHSLLRKYWNSFRCRQMMTPEQGKAQFSPSKIWIVLIFLLSLYPTQVAHKGERVKDIDGTEADKAVCRAGLKGRFQNVIFCVQISQICFSQRIFATKRPCWVYYIPMFGSYHLLPT